MKNLLFIFSICCLLVACTRDSEDSVNPINSQPGTNDSPVSTRTSNTIAVNGIIEENLIQLNINPHGIIATASDIWTGDLTGNGHIHIFSADIIDFNIPITQNIIGDRKLFTSEGNLFLSEVGIHFGDVVTVIATLAGGTGIYKNATGQLNLNGLHSETGVHFTYTGNITLAN